MLTNFFALDVLVVDSSIASTIDLSIVSVAWAAWPCIDFGQSLIMWPLLVHNKQKLPSVHRWHSWGVSLPSLLSLSIKSGFFCVGSLCFFLFLESDTSFIGWLWLGRLIPGSSIGLGSGAILAGNLSLVLPILLVDLEHQVS